HARRVDIARRFDGIHARSNGWSGRVDGRARSWFLLGSEPHVVFSLAISVGGTRLSESMQAAVWTIGHSTRQLTEFLSIIAEYRMELIVDVRRYPGSRRLPHFASGPLESSLAAAGIAYQWI